MALTCFSPSVEDRRAAKFIDWPDPGTGIIHGRGKVGGFPGPPDSHDYSPGFTVWMEERWVKKYSRPGRLRLRHPQGAAHCRLGPDCPERRSGEL